MIQKQKTIILQIKIASKCDKPELPNMIVSPDKPIYYVKDIVTWTCKLGYRLEGSPQSLCGLRGEFLNIPRCVVSQCLLNGKILGNAQLKSAKKDVYEFNESIELECSHGQVMDGPSTAFCLRNGNFTKISRCIENPKLREIEERLNTSVLKTLKKIEMMIEKERKSIIYYLISILLLIILIGVLGVSNGIVRIYKIPNLRKKERHPHRRREKAESNNTELNLCN